jgi:predicted phosphodiesterase
MKAGAFSACLLLLLVPTAHAQASQQQIDSSNAHPYKIYDTTPVILAGPFLLNTSETSTTVEWITDTECYPKLEYGESKLDHEIIPQEHGLVPVGTLQRIELKGLQPGHTYQYRVSSTRIIRLKPYMPDMGHALQTPVYSFTTLDHSKSTAAFSFITDTHENIPRIQTLMQMIDWKTNDFLVTGGDGVNYADNQDQVFSNWIEPVSEGLNHTKSLLYVRGNHDMRGPFARNLADYLLDPSGQYYFTRDDGPLHLIVVDTGEDKPDTNQAYAGLLADDPYRAEEYDWFKNLPATDPRLGKAPFRVVLMHQPHWGWVNGDNHRWTEVANQDKIDLVIAGHNHVFSHIQTGAEGNNFPILIVGQDQVAHVEATEQEIKITVTAKNGSVVDSFTVKHH